MYHILHFEKPCILSYHVFLGLHRVHHMEKGSCKEEGFVLVAACQTLEFSSEARVNKKPRRSIKIRSSSLWTRTY